MFSRNSHYFAKYHQRPDDWNCPICNFKVYGSKNICLKCNADKFGNFLNKAKIHPSGDWICLKCKFRVFSDRQYCNNCHIDKYGKNEIIETQ